MYMFDKRRLLSVIIFVVTRSAANIWLLTAREILSNLLSSRITFSFITLSILFLVTLHSGASTFERQLVMWTRSQSSTDEVLFAGKADYDFADGVSIRVIESVQRPKVVQKPILLSIFAKGFTKELEREINIGPSSASNVAVSFRFGSYKASEPLSELFTTFDLVHICTLVISLLALLFTYDAVTGEKETGTLRAVFSNPIRRRRFILSKFLGSVMSFIPLIVLAYSLSVTSLITLRHLPLTFEQYIRLVILLGALVLYGLIFLALGLMISTLTSSQRTAAIMSVSTWIVFVVILPGLALILANIASPARSFTQNMATSSLAIQDILKDDHAAHGQAQRRGRFPISNEGFLRIRSVGKALDDDFLNQKLALVRSAKRLSRISPTGSFMFATSEIAGTGVAQFSKQMEFLKAARDALLEEANEGLRQPRRMLYGPRWREVLSQINSRQREAASLEASINAAAPDLVFLFSWAMGLFVAAVLIFERYDLR